MAVVFVELGIFSRDRRAMGLVDEDLRALQRAILLEPESAPVIAGTGGLRKMRFAPPSWRTGKSGALRVCYAWFPAHGRVVLVRAYAKARQADLAPAERVEIARLLAEIERGFGKRTGGRT
ncbi:MAG: hypothetical protein HRF43_09825 [Phycisphaerae bacterium]|jgi:hypothetical protein